MESNESSDVKAPRKKMRFAPKPLNKDQKPPLPPPKVEIFEEEEIDAAEAKHLLRRLQDTYAAVKPSAVKKDRPVQVAFGHGASSQTIRSYGSSGSAESFLGGEMEKKEEYEEPFDYSLNYPVALPWRKPYSGNPDDLNEKEFREDPETRTWDNEDAINPAEELGLQEESPETDMLFVQLPMMNELNELKGGGLIGKMVVYRSGAVKLKIGDILYDVSPGLKSGFPQNVFAVNSEDKKCTNLGELNARAIVTPDVNSLLASMSDL